MRMRRGASIAEDRRGIHAHPGPRAAAVDSGAHGSGTRPETDPRASSIGWFAREIFEQVLQTRYLGTKRYSLEGEAALIPLLDAILSAAAEQGAEQAVLAMSHRGRLNVMVHIVGEARRKCSRDLRTWIRAACWAAAT